MCVEWQYVNLLLSSGFLILEKVVSSPVSSCCQLPFRYSQRHDQFGSKEENFHPAEDGEAGEEPHCAADETNLTGNSHLHISLYLVIGCRVEVDMDQLQGSVLNCSS